MTHPTQVFLSNPQALRVEFRLDDQRLLVWWSPKAGSSTHCRDRNFSNRDNHLEVFTRITLPGCGLEGFLGCDYDPYHCVLRFNRQTLHLAVRHDAPAVLLWTEHPQAVDFKTDRYDAVVAQAPGLFAVRHAEPSYTFEFAAATGPGEGGIRFSPVHAEWNSHYTRADLAAGQLLVVGVGLAGEDAAGMTARLAAQPADAHIAATDAALEPLVAAGRVTAPAHPALVDLRRTVVRCLHSMIDESGAMRASIKAIYYLIWIRDAGFSFPYQEAAGWPHKLPEVCRLLLDNPATARGDDVPPGRLFGQLVNRDYGKYEEDGLFYVTWLLFTSWTRTGRLDFVSGADWDLLAEALDWVEQATWDARRGLFGEHFADETPALGWRDHGSDYAIGMPADDRDVIRHDGQRVVRSYDSYFNLIMHSTYTMLAALQPARFGHLAARAEVLWQALEPLLGQRTDGLPPYGELLLESGERVVCPYWGPATSVYIWGLVMPCFAPLADWDAVRERLLDTIMEQPRMHWINGICAAAAAVDPWFAGEGRQLAVLDAVARDALRPGKYLPMGGAMPEKMDAPEGNLYHDIRPQAFAMGAWLATLSAPGVRRLPYGLALRPTTAIESITGFRWRDATLDFTFGPAGPALALEIDGRPVPHTLQIPEARLLPGRNTVRLVDGQAGPLLVRSTVALVDISPAAGAQVVYTLEAHGLSELLFAGPVSIVSLHSASGGPVAHSLEDYRGGSMLRFTATGRLDLAVAESGPRTTRRQP